MNQLGSGSGRCGYLLAYVQEFHFSMHYTQINDYLSRITDTACQTLSLSNDDMEFMDESSDYRRCRNDSCTGPAVEIRTPKSYASQWQAMSRMNFLD